MFEHPNRVIVGVLASAVTLIITAAPVSAQTASTAAPADTTGAVESDQLAEVVVTAEKRTQNLQDVPETVSAVSGTEMLTQGVKDITDLTRVAPEVSVTAAGQINNVDIRGIRSGSAGPSLDSANSVYQDGNYNARFTSLNGLFFDVQRVEVLDGPQGTLYGRNSAGGAINIISNKPTETFGGYGFLEFGNYSDVNLNGAVNLPLSDTVAFRLAYFKDSHSGFDTDSGDNDLNLQGGRGELLWKPSSNDSLLLTAQESLVGGKGPGASTIVSVFKNPTITTDTTTGNVLAYNAKCAAGHVCTTQVVPINATDSPSHNAVLAGQANLTFTNTHNDAFALQYDHTFDQFATLTFQGSRMSTRSENGSGAVGGLEQNPLLVASNLFLTSGGATPFSAPDGVHDTWDSEELRLTSVNTKPLQWVLGLYRYHEGGTDLTNTTFSTTSTTAVGASAGSLVFPAGSPVNAQDIPQLLYTDLSRAVFGQATYTPGFIDRLHLTLGGRYNRESKQGISTIYPSTGPIATAAFGPGGIFNQSNTWSASTYKADIAYDIRPQNMVYIDHSTGYQAGGYGYGSSPAYGPTHLWAWELGSKNRFFNNSLQVNASAWYYNYADQPQNISDVFLVSFAPGAPPTPFSFITVANAGTSISRGQSLDIVWNVTPDDELSLNLQHINAVFTNYNLTARYLGLAAKVNPSNPAGEFALLYPGYSATGNQGGPSFNYNGTNVGLTPDFGSIDSYQHTFHLGERQLSAQVVYRYNGREIGGNQEAPNMPPYNGFWTLPGWSTWDLYLSYIGEGGKYNISLFSRNIFNRYYATGRGYSNNGAALAPAQSLYAYETESFGAPRTYGIIVQANF